MKPKKMKVVKPSKRSEVWYREQLELIIKVLKDAALSAFITVNDAPSAGELAQAQKLLSVATDRMMNVPIFDSASRISESFVRRVERAQYNRMAEEYKVRFGIDISPQVSKEMLDEAIQSNVNLITSIKTDFIAQIGDEVRAQLLKGERSTGLIKIIHEQGKVSENRAKFIARDQTAKLNAAIIKDRNERLGIKTYIWVGAGDNRERPGHKAMNGKLCRFDDPTVYSDDNGDTWKKRKSIGGVELHPGEDYQCRCGAAPRLEW